MGHHPARLECTSFYTIACSHPKWRGFGLVSVCVDVRRHQGRGVHVCVCVCVMIELFAAGELEHWARSVVARRHDLVFFCFFFLPWLLHAGAFSSVGRGSVCGVPTQNLRTHASCVL